jgi:hypothetical protein
MNKLFHDINILDIMKLPDELLREIYDYIPYKNRIFLTKNNYEKYHSFIIRYIPNYDSFIRNIIRNDYLFVFEKHMRENNKKWLEKKKYYYKNKIFSNFGYFILEYCIENNSEKCKTLLTDFWCKEGLCQNRHKKNIYKHIRWKK